MPNPLSKLKERLRTRSPTAPPQPTRKATLPASVKPNPGQTDLWTEAFQELPPDHQASLQQLLAKDQAKCRVATSVSGSTLSYSILAEGLKDLVIQKRDECERNRWRFTLQGRDIILRDIAEKVVIWFDRFKDIGNAIASYDPVHLALPWAGIRFLLECAVHERQQMASLLVGVERVSYLMNRCTVYEVLYIRNPEPGQAFENLRVALKKLYTVIFVFLEAMCQTHTESLVKKTLSMVFKPDQFDEFLQKCDDLEGRVDIEADNCERTYRRTDNVQFNEKLDKLRAILQQMTEPIVRIDKKVTELWNNSRRSQVSEILGWVSQIPYEDNHKRAREDHVASTGQWLLDHKGYQTWRRSSASTIIWLHGIPGAGKTKLISCVVENVLQSLEKQRNDEGFAYFYCDRNEKDRQDPQSILRSFVKQLGTSRVDQSLQTSLIDSYQRKQLTGFASNQLDVKECQELLQRYVDLYPQTTIVIDALDECDPLKRQILINFFDHAVRLATRPVKIMISSRPDDDIKFRFETGPNIGISATDNQDDITKFIIQRLQEANRNRRNKLSPEIEHDIIDTIRNKSNGMFQWAALQINHLLELRLESDMRDRLGKLPDDLKKAYDEILEKINSQPGSAVKIAFRAFCWVMQAEVPVSSHLLVSATCQDPEAEQISPVNIDIDFVLDACKNLLVIDHQLQVCRFSHLSVQEYLETWVMKPIDADHSISRICMQMLMDKDTCKEPLLGYEEFYARELNQRIIPNYTITEEADSFYGEYLMERRLNTYSDTGLDSLFAYSVTQWSYHAQRCEEPESKVHLTKTLLRFLGSPSDATDQYRWWHYMISQRRYPEGIQNPMVHVNEQLRPRSSPIFTVCRLGLYSVLAAWQTSDALDLFQRNEWGDTLLLLAAQSGSRKTCEVLVDAGLEVNVKVRRGGFALSSACENNCKEVVKFLLDRGADVNLVGGAFGSALAAASYHGDKKTVELLLDYGADINLVGTVYGTALAAAAASSRSKEIVELLLDHGADVNLTGGRCHTALATASHYGNKEIVELLLNHRADTHLIGGIHGTALAAASYIGDKSIVELLLDHGANINLVGGKYGTALVTASRYGNMETVRLLLDRGAHVDLIGSDYGTALAVALFEDYTDIVQLLIDHGAVSEIAVGEES